ncbi:MAG: hypothetical protein LBT04_07835 [Prevotellaceae bacterium]|jgi:hypothetical protein|nr:hypothetical protein [Prevotellaceae bacterium]
MKINLALNQQGAYTTWYVSVSGDNYLENIPSQRKLITVSGAAIPEFAPYNLGADPTYNTPIKQMTYLANHNFDDIDGHVYGGRFQWGREWDNTSDATSYPITVGGTYRLWKGSTDSNHAYYWDDNVAYNSVGQVTYPIGSHIFNNLLDDWHQPTRDNSLWGKRQRHCC